MLEKLAAEATRFCHLYTEEQAMDIIQADVMFWVAYLIIPASLVIGLLRSLKSLRHTAILPWAVVVTLSALAFIACCGWFHYADVAVYGSQQWYMLGATPVEYMVSVAKLGGWVSMIVALMYMPLFVYVGPRALAQYFVMAREIERLKAIVDTLPTVNDPPQ